MADYLRKVHFDDQARDKAMAAYLQCDGMLATESDHCLERLACEFSDSAAYRAATELDRAVTSILISHILNNPFVSDALKISMKNAAVYGRDNRGMCGKYKCAKIK